MDREPRPEADNESQISEHMEDDQFEEAPPSNFEEDRSDEENEDTERKNTRATDADIDETILDHQVFNGRPISAPAPHSSVYGHKEREQNAIEFWELAHLLAKALSVELPDHVESDFSAIDMDEGTNVEHHRRELAINSIMEKITDILERIRRSEEHRGMASRQQSVKSSKSNDEEHQSKVRSASLSNASSARRPLELSFHRVESIIE